MLPFLLLVVMQMTLLQGIFAEVVHAPSKAADVYECRLLGGDPAAAIYTWSRNNSSGGLQLVYVVPVKNPTYDQEYKCVTEPGMENTNYSWYRKTLLLPITGHEGSNECFVDDENDSVEVSPTERLGEVSDKCVRQCFPPPSHLMEYHLK
ncbi:hypothetical protein C0J50_0112 [Silurus asotus]|uniref:Ig-like domain-containing protein n=1 Tax=Silurus asotus TaxID=30991 RepID=A0AAD5FFW7_SILAS|nr:hypothetical protein C0J50_0112 [Silurus asotus]